MKENMGILSEKTEVLHADLNERAEAATINYSAEVEFFTIFYLFGACA